MAPWKPCEPNLLRVRRGWLALSPRSHPYRIGVLGNSEDEARRRFDIAVQAWKELHEQAEADQRKVP
jgi:hypothetical protein